MVSFVKILAASILALAALGSSSIFAQEKGDRSVNQYTCKDIMRESGSSRDVSIAFIHAYLLGKSNATTFNVGNLQQQTEAFINYCLDNPNEKALDAMIKVKG